MHRSTEQKIVNLSAHVLASGRNDRAGYESYYAGMDSSARQKSALTTTLIDPRGAVVVDMGAGTGQTSHDIANLYPDNEVIGIDVDPVAIEHSRQKYVRSNLRFQQQDATALEFDPLSVDVFHNSSFLHEVASYSSPPFDLSKVLASLNAQSHALKIGGKLIVRDFVIPSGPELVVLTLPASDGLSDGAPQELSTAALLRRFVGEFRSSQYPAGCADQLHLVGATETGKVQFVLPLRLAAEFALRKDYRERWEAELAEEYTYLSQRDFEQHFNTLGLRVVIAQEIHNPWIVSKRFERIIELHDLLGNRLPHIPTNFFIVGEKVPADVGVRLEQVGCEPITQPHYLSASVYRSVDGLQMEVVSRKNRTVDLLPWFEDQNGQLQVIAKQGYPRPIVNVIDAAQKLDRSSTAGYLTEVVSGVLHAEDRDLESAAHRILVERAGLDQELDSQWSSFFSSPGGIDEQIHLNLKRVGPVRDLSVPQANYSNLSTSGTIRPFDAEQVLRSYQVGGMFESRLEVAIYQLFRTLDRTPGEWIGAKPELSLQAVNTADIQACKQALCVPQRSLYTLQHSSDLKYLQIYQGHFVDRAANGEALASVALEYVVPAPVSSNTLTLLPIVMSAEGPLVGLELRDLPVPQIYSGSSTILTAPAFRLPHQITDTHHALWYVRARLAHEFGLQTKGTTPLGGKTYLSPGIIPEATYSYLFEVGAEEISAAASISGMRWVRLAELARSLEKLNCLQTTQIVCRAAHALGVF